MKKTPLMIIGITLTTILVSSCTGMRNISSSTFKNEITTEDLELINLNDLKEKKISISIWNDLGGNKFSTFEEYIDEFRLLYPNVTINQFNKGLSDDLDYSITAAIPAKTTPTMAFVKHQYIPRYVSYGAIENMAPYINAENIGLNNNDLEDYISGFWENGHSYSLNTEQYSLPFSNYTNVLYYNSLYFNENQTEILNNASWLEKNENSIINIARKIKEKNPSIIPLYIEDSSFIYICLSMQLSIPYVQIQGLVEGKNIFANEQALSMVKLVKSWVDEGLVVIGNALNIDANKNPFDYNVAMVIASTNNVNRYKLNNSINVALIPQENKEYLFNEIYSHEAIIFQKASIEEKIISWLFYKFITTKEKALDYSLKYGYMPIKYSSLDLPDFQKEISKIETNEENLNVRLLKKYSDIYSSLKSIPSFVGYDVTRREIGELLMTIYRKDFSTLNEIEIDEYITQCFKKALTYSDLAKGNN